MADDLAARLTATREAYRALRPRIEAREATDPWPLATAFGTEPEASWGVREVLAHVQEMLPYWLGEFERVQAGDGATPVPFGRVATDALRTGVLERDRTLPLRELFARIEFGHRAVAGSLRGGCGRAVGRRAPRGHPSTVG